MRYLLASSVLALAAAAAPLAAQVCSPTAASTVPAFEGVKTAFLEGVTREELEPLLASMSVSEEMWADLVTRLPEVYPDGFARCGSIALRLDEPGLAQEVFVLVPEAQTSALFIYLSGIFLDGEIQVIGMSYDTRVGEVLGLLR